MNRVTDIDKGLLMLTLAQVAKNPNMLTEHIVIGSESLTVRPLEQSDVLGLATFLENLSGQTRRFSTFYGYDVDMAQDLCDAIARYDKLRFVIESTSHQIIGLMEFSFDLVNDDIARYRSYHVELNPETDFRFGPTLADDYQNKGIGTLMMPFIKNVARKFGQDRIILWGGVFGDNRRAIRFYEKNGFKQVGMFMSDGAETIDMILEL